jgi:hypothetical protein
MPSMIVRVSRVKNAGSNCIHIVLQKMMVCKCVDMCVRTNTHSNAQQHAYIYCAREYMKF